MPLPHTPVYDRTLSDVQNKTAKGYFNVEDWERVDDNVIELMTLVDSKLGTGVSSSYIAPSFSLSYFTSAQDINAMCGNIEAVRSFIVSKSPVIAASLSSAGVVEIKDDWVAGPHEPSANFRHANDWEKTIYIIYNALENTTTTRKPRTGIAVCGASMTKNNMFRSY